MPESKDGRDTRYSAARFARVPYAAYSNPNGAASQDERGVPFLMGNDRYQVIVCSSTGAGGDTPEFRYWFAGGAPWGEKIAVDSNHPPFHTVDENDAAVSADIELPFQQFKGAARATIQGLYVHYVPQPLIVDPTATGVDVTFSVRVEGDGLPGFSTSAGSGMVTGVVTSDVWTVTQEVDTSASDPWPNILSAFVPVRLDAPVSEARVIFTEFKLAELVGVQMVGQQVPWRNV